jgi:hypothetical protein
MDSVFVVKRLSVDEDLFIADFDLVSSRTYNSFNIVEFRIPGKLENNNVIGLRISHRKDYRTRKGHFHTIDKFTDKNMVTDLQGRQHRSGGDLKGLNNKSANEKSENKRYDNGFCIFSKG